MGLDDSFATPTREEQRLAAAGVGRLSALAAELRENDDATAGLVLHGARGAVEVPIPSAALDVLVDVLEQFAQGCAVTVAPLDQELSTNEVARLLNVSRPYVIGLMEAGKIPFHAVGTHRRARFGDVMRYKRERTRIAEEAYQEMVAITEELGLYDE